MTVGAAASLAGWRRLTAEAGLAGLEFACGIPGSVGGGVAMNAGAYGSSLVDVVREVEMASAAGSPLGAGLGVRLGLPLLRSASGRGGHRGPFRTRAR